MKKYVLPYGQGSKEIELDETLVLKEVSEKVSEGKKPYLRPKARLLDKDISLGR